MNTTDDDDDDVVDETATYHFTSKVFFFRFLETIKIDLIYVWLLKSIWRFVLRAHYFAEEQ